MPNILFLQQTPGGYGLMPYRLPMQNQPGFHNMMPHMNQGNAVRPDLGHNMNLRNYPAPASYIGSYPAVPGIQHPMAYPRGSVSPRQVSSSAGSVSPGGGNSNSSSSGGNRSSSGQVEGCLSISYIYVRGVYITCMQNRKC